MEADRRDHMELDASELALIAAARAGDQLAYEALERQYRPLLSAQVSYAMNALPPSLQEDCMQVAREAFHSAVCHYDATHRVAFGYFAKICIRNGVCSYFRKQSARVRREQNVAEEELMLHWSNAAEDAPAHRILAQEDWAQWNEGLSSFEREVLAYFFAGNKPRQIAQALGRSPKSVYNALVRIRGKKKKS